MRRALRIGTAVGLVAAVLAAVAGMMWVPGCGVMYKAGTSPMMAMRGAAPKAHGGTHNVNDAAFDAMFFKNYGVNPFIDTDDDHLSTFAVDVDTGSYTLARAYLERGSLPERDGVRVEEFVNYFDYGYAPPAGGAAPVAIHLAAAPSAFRPDRTVLGVALKARVIPPAQRKDAVLTFVIDISGSMAREDRLELVKKSLRLLLDQLRGGDRVGIAVYGSEGREYLAHAGVDDRGEILRAIDRLGPGGSTNAEEGIVIGYRMAARAFRAGAINRVILCSDGVANVGRTGPESIFKQIAQYRDEGVTLSTVGFGMGNYNDVLMEQLADKGAGNYAYVDTPAEARRVFVENLTGLLQVVARDVKVQVDFDRSAVRSYRLIGYENRDVADKDFRNDKVDGGAVGSGHSVTALYELKLWPGKAGRLAGVTVRYKDPESREPAEVSRELTTAEVAKASPSAASWLRLAGAAAEFAEVLRHSYWARQTRLDDVLTAANQCRPAFPADQKLAELIRLIDHARRLKADARDSEGHKNIEGE